MKYLRHAARQVWYFARTLRLQSPIYRQAKVPEPYNLIPAPDPDALFVIKGVLAGKRVQIVRASGARARTDWELLTKQGKPGSIEFRHFYQGEWHVRNRYEKEDAAA